MLKKNKSAINLKEISIENNILKEKVKKIEKNYDHLIKENLKLKSQIKDKSNDFNEIKKELKFFKKELNQIKSNQNIFTQSINM